MPGFGHNVFLHEAASGAVALVSHVAGSPTSGGNAISGMPAVDGVGTYVAFVSEATDLVNGVDANGAFDLFLTSAPRIRCRSPAMSLRPRRRLETGPLEPNSRSRTGSLGSAAMVSAWPSRARRATSWPEI